MVTYVGEVREGRVVVPDSLSAWEGARAIVLLDNRTTDADHRRTAVQAFIEAMQRGFEMPEGRYPSRSETYADREERYGAGIR
ncbi:MAG: hypothetical protein FJX72_04865 [Armatimonadetes bacterium]|nr:hypothetical protein [Armatimonadota bacterium]